MITGASAASPSRSTRPAARSLGFVAAAPGLGRSCRWSSGCSRRCCCPTRWPRARADAVRARPVGADRQTYEGMKSPDAAETRHRGAGRHARAGADAVQPRPDGLPVAGAGRRRLGLSALHPRRAGPARGGRKPRQRARAGLQGRAHPPGGDPLRRRLRGAGRRLHQPRARAAMDRRHDRRRGLDRAGHRGLRLVAAGRRGRRCLSLRRGDGAAAEPPGRGRRRTGRALVAAGLALYCHHPRARDHLGPRDRAWRARLAGPAFPRLVG